MPSAAEREGATDDESAELDRIRRWREKAAVLEGCSILAAAEFAVGDGDLRELRRLVREKGCDPDLAARIA